MNNYLGVVLCISIIIISGCYGNPQGNTSEQNEECIRGESMTFPGLQSSITDNMWSNDRVIVGGFQTLENTDIIFVVYDNETVIGTRTFHSQDPVAIDGINIPLEEPLSGVHNVSVMMYTDINDNGGLDEADEICSNQSNPIKAGPREINFSSFNESGTSA